MAFVLFGMQKSPTGGGAFLLYFDKNQ